MKVTNPILLIMLFAFTFASAFAQPLPDPFTVSETDSDAVVSDVRITMRDNAIVDVFFLETRGTAVSPDNHLLHAVVSLTTEQIIAGPEDMPVENGWNLIIGDVASRGNDGWLAMIYESQSVSMDNWIVNRTSLLYGQNNIQGVVELDTGRAQETASPPYNCEIAHSNAQFGISERVGGGWLLHWVRRGCQMFPDSLESFPRNTAQLVALSSSMDIDARTSCCSEDYSFGAQEVRCVSATPDTTVVLSMDWTENGAAEPFPVMMKWLSLSGNCISRGIPGALFFPYCPNTFRKVSRARTASGRDKRCNFISGRIGSNHGKHSFKHITLQRMEPGCLSSRLRFCLPIALKQLAAFPREN